MIMTVTMMPGGRPAAANEVPAAVAERLVGETLEDMARRDPKPVRRSGLRPESWSPRWPGRAGWTI
jgi:hypothetical protein